MYFKTVNSLEEVNLDQLAKLYQNVYGAAPWSEYKKVIDSTGAIIKSWGFEDSAELETYNGVYQGMKIVDYWDFEELKKFFVAISQKKLFSGVIACSKVDEIVGFVWAFEYALDEIDSTMGVENLSKILDNFEAPYVYCADIGIDQNYRMQGYAKEMFALQNAILKEKNVGSFYTRTKGGENPSVTHLWWEKAGIPVVYHYYDERQRVIRAKNII